MDRYSARQRGWFTGLYRRTLRGGCVVIYLPERRVSLSIDGQTATDWSWSVPGRKSARQAKRKGVG